jgi:hypothetical protein
VTFNKNDFDDLSDRLKVELDEVNNTLTFTQINNKNLITLSNYNIELIPEGGNSIKAKFQTKPMGILGQDDSNNSLDYSEVNYTNY